MNGECTPLVRNTTGSGAQSTKRTLFFLLLICVLERCTFYEYIADVPQIEPKQNNSNFCDVLGDGSPMELESSWRSHILLGVAYTLPLSGGFAADRRFGCWPVLMFGCGLYCLGACMMVCMVYCRELCSNALKYICQVVLAFATGLVRPNLMVLSYDLGAPLLGTTGLCFLYYEAEVVGQILGSSLSFATDKINHPLTGSCVPTTIAMLFTAAFACRMHRSGWAPSQFHLPSRQSIKYILYLITPIILQSVVLMLTLFTISGWEISYLRNQSTHADMMVNSDLLMLAWSVALLPTVAILWLLTHLTTSLKSPSLRVCLGIFVLAVVQFQACGFNFSLKDESNMMQDFILGYQSVFGALAESFIFIAANEMAFRIAEAEIKTFIVGIFMSLKGAGFLTTIIILFSCLTTAKGNSDALVKKFAYMHLGLGLALSASVPIVLLTAPNAYRWLLSYRDQRVRQQLQSQ